MNIPIEMNGETYLTAAEAARYLGVSRETFYNNTRGKVQTYNVGVLRRLYYKKSDIDEYRGVRPSDGQDTTPRQ